MSGLMADGAPEETKHGFERRSLVIIAATIVAAVAMVFMANQLHRVGEQEVLAQYGSHQEETVARIAAGIRSSVDACGHQLLGLSTILSVEALATALSIRLNSEKSSSGRR
jgi:hypothetical protein